MLKMVYFNVCVHEHQEFAKSQTIMSIFIICLFTSFMTKPPFNFHLIKTSILKNPALY